MDSLNTLCGALEKSYSDRAADRSAFAHTWKECTEAFPPALGPMYTVNELPSFHFACNAGDMGLAVLWIVQAALIRPFVNRIISLQRTFPESLSAIHPETIGSLAHSEDSNNPVTIQEEAGHIVINGLKKYITGGLNSDFILLTARKPGEEKVSHLIHIPASMLPHGALQELSLGTLETTSHASLRLQGLQLPEEYVIPFEPGTMRKILKVQGILERSLIMQSYIGLLMYIAGRTEGLPESTFHRMHSLLNEHNAILKAQIDAVHAGKRINPVSVDIRELSSIIETLKKHNAEHHGDTNTAMRLRFRDLEFFSRSGT
ncbi:MAG TPA: hypothetical protein PK544_02375 [Spirochaetota bacterium]|nr:hypothetical protein [Spirochaetota bacterium]